MAYPSQNIPTTLGTFVDGQVVSANDATYGLNPKMEQIRSVVNDHATKLDTLNSQVSALGGLVYNVVAYGADPTGVADSTSAIQSAVSAAVSNQGIVVFSNGIYKVTDQITVSGTCYITSDGSGQGVTINQTTVSKSIFRLTSNYIRITDLKLNYANASATTAPLIYMFGTLTSIVIQRCTFSSSLNQPITAIGSGSTTITGLAVTDCIVAGTASYYHTFISLYSIATSIISRNTCSYCTGTIAVSAGVIGTIIEQNSITNYKGNGISLTSLSTPIFVDKNSIVTSKDSTGSYAAIYASTGVGLTVSDNYIDNTSSTATSGDHKGIYTVDAIVASIYRNTIYNGKYAIHIVSSGGSTITTISDNTLVSPELYGIYFGAYAGVANVCNNTIYEVWSNASVTYCIYFSNGGYAYNATVSDNTVLDFGGVTATYKNSYGLAITNGGYGTRTACASGNNFTKTNVAAISAADFSVYYQEATGASVYNTTTAAPISGTWKRGDKVILSTPSASGYLGYVCTTAGTPGTWKGYGTIQA